MIDHRATWHVFIQTTNMFWCYRHPNPNCLCLFSKYCSNYSWGTWKNQTDNSPNITCIPSHEKSRWWRHQMETFSALLALCAGNSPATGEFPTQRPVTRSCLVFFDLRMNKRLSKQSRRQWFKTPSRSLWRHCNEKWKFCNKIRREMSYLHVFCWYSGNCFQLLKSYRRSLTVFSYIM